ncbi:DUF4169 family protein [Rhodopseudomonas boonkerdii]|uniref:DUF4169 family protein n=1 Tax=Rhodopseudomonas boonkerdii TaxID=475937 RepID=UPI001E5E048E|nr:DUF4169 family protein [Rhodopseudomonas boonkerdii]UGV25787.1 DUF4169 family protein [Rhodopseudomonas boonkerdii]
MGDLINLNRFRKRAARDEASRQADINRARFGRIKSERTLEEQRTARANTMLDQHKIDGESAS